MKEITFYIAGLLAVGLVGLFFLWQDYRDLQKCETRYQGILSEWEHEGEDDCLWLETSIDQGKFWRRYYGGEISYPFQVRIHNQCEVKR